MTKTDATFYNEKTRIVDDGGTDVTESTGHSVKATIQAGTAVIGKTGHDITSIADNRKVVTTAGTAVALAASTPAKYVILTAETDNTGVIVVGGSTVVAAQATRRGTPLNPGASMGVPCDNLADIYIDSTVSGDGVTFAHLS